ncbi:hypothetical protein R1T16_04570 [Flavobacterium sp. DG1-102-2]|uniref:hypothetical protein n=1 Tax=Flavobacterium sp. DG1-102-2 TaxID=3081663 RepID=UPI00294A64D6|nr:hypothetical protein [Flavobacterium sp. DG1-102-2]MDV6167686.1 hypothetical protein [Flavobacterium sp. DG1-102-2]
MRKILLLLTTLFILNSCTLEPDPQPDYNIEFIAADGVIVPASVIKGRTYEVTVAYTKPTGCYLFDRFHTEKDGDAILIAVQAAVRNESECKKYEVEQHEEQSFTFTCPIDYALDCYIFKFYTGLDDNGIKTYEQVKIPVRK